MLLPLHTLTLAARPFLDPQPWERYWYLLLIPMALGIALAYKAVRVPDMSRFWIQALAMTVQIVAGMIALGAFTFVFVQYLLPMIAIK
jgi:hypothetical protein